MFESTLPVIGFACKGREAGVEVKGLTVLFVDISGWSVATVSYALLVVIVVSSTVVDGNSVVTEPDKSDC